jgi:hypothetical protein
MDDGYDNLQIILPVTSSDAPEASEGYWSWGRVI